MDGLQRPPGYRASHGHARYKSHLSPQVDTVSSVEIAHQLHRGVEINTFKLATFVKVEERGMKSRQRFNTHTHVTSARPPPPLHRRREYQPPSSSFRFRRRSRINTNTPPPLEHFCIRLAASGLSRTLSLLLVSSPLQDATTESRHQPPPPAHRSARRPVG